MEVPKLTSTVWFDALLHTRTNGGKKEEEPTADGAELIFPLLEGTESELS
jgi:hypothetical protein